MAHSQLIDAPVVPMLAEDNLEVARRFWRDTVGVQEIDYSERMREAMYRAGGTIFGIYEHPGGSHADHTQLAFQVGSVRAVKRELEEDGVTFEEYNQPGLKTVQGLANMGDGTEGAWFRDPGGNIVGMFTASHQMMQKLQAAHMTATELTP